MTRAGQDGRAGQVVRLKSRASFLRAASGRKFHSALFTLQGTLRPEGEAEQARVGFTVTKKVGGAVERNRIKRRLREAVRLAPGLGLEPTHDYVIVARRVVLDAPFPALASGLRAGLAKLKMPKRAIGAARDAVIKPDRGGA